MPVTVVVGTQWGDEGKGKVVDLLTRDMDMVVRYQGGNNAGHTVVIGKNVFKLHLIPSGIFSPRVICLIGNGVVINPAVLLDEISLLASQGIDTDNLRISPHAHVILPYHIALDQAQEERHEAGRIGTTNRGIGPCYVDKMNRRGIRIGDLYHPSVFEEKLKWNISEKTTLIEKFYGKKVSLDGAAIFKEYSDYAERIRKYVVEDAVGLVHDAISAGKKILLEGAQGTMLDVDQGTYPFVTSSNPIAGGACAGVGIGPTQINEVIGVAKAYVTRVGSGPFPTEIDDPLGIDLREKGKEYGATTGRPRRCGWFDAIVLRHAVRTNGLTQLAITKLDILDDLPALKICVAYELNGRKITHFPVDLTDLQQCNPIYEEVPGWAGPTCGIPTFEKLPEPARRYLDKISGFVGVPISLVSVGAERGQVIRHPRPVASLAA